MGAQLRSLSLFLLLLLTFQESGAALCQAPSRSFHGLCLSSKNCLAICEKEGFLSGECKRLKCVCAKDCKSGGGPGEGPPGQGGEEPGEGPPGQGGEEPGEGPPGQGGEGGEEPGEGPPGQGGEGGEEPGEGPPGQGGDEPGEGPPGDGGEEPVAKPPIHSSRYLLNN